jgi:hypothetical protein
MDTRLGIMKAESARACGARHKVFDWEKAARLIKEARAIEAYAGLAQDWEWTGGRILLDGKPDMESYTYLCSNWATPELIIGSPDGQPTDCWRYTDDGPEWYADTKWPPEALAILGLST